jgi:hypothetical protein
MTGEQIHRPRCRCGVYIDCHPRFGDHKPRKASRLRLWFHDHLLSDHIIAPLWLRTPEKWRWRYVNWLNNSQKTCWSDLVSAALAVPERDACDMKLPTRCGSGTCPTTCDWSHFEHVGEHECSCYCGKFQFTAPEGAIDRRERSLRPGKSGNG